MSRDEYSFAAACRAADERQRNKPRDPHLEWLRVLLDENKVPSIEAAYAAFDAERRKYGAAPSTVEALMWTLRDGLEAIKHPDSLRRLGELNDAQMRAVAARVQKFAPHIAPAWEPADVEALISVWSKLRC